MKKVVLFVILIAIIISGVKLVKSTKDDLASLPKALKPVFSVNVVNTKERTVQESSSFIAKLESDNSINVSTKISGFIKKIYVSENDVVKKGDLLLEIDSKEVDESLKQIINSSKSLELSIQSIKTNITSLKNDLKASKSRLNRNIVLHQAGGLSKEKLEISEVDYQIKKARLDSTLKSIESKQYELESIKNTYNSKKASLEYYNIKAPINGIIDVVTLKDGDLVIGGKTILRLLDKKQKLTFSFASKDIKKGLQVLVNDSIKAEVSNVLKSSDKYLYQAEIDLDTPLDLPMGSFVDIKVITKNSTSFSLPSNTILHKKDGNFIVVYDSGTFKLKKVDILVESEEFVITKNKINQKVALASESKLAILPSSNNYKIVDK